MNIWLKDPKNNKRSVSLTMLVIATSCLMITIILPLFGITKGDLDKITPLVTQFWFGSISLYFGRKVKWSKDGGEIGYKED